jgi:hypothetical protein
LSELKFYQGLLLLEQQGLLELPELPDQMD